MEIVGQRLRLLRENLEVSQGAIAKLVGVKQPTINRYEIGAVNPPYERIVWFADFYDVSLDYLLGRTDEPRGKLYQHEPDLLKEKFQDEEKMKAFVEFCFEPGTVANEKLKAVLVDMLRGSPPKKKKETSK